MSARAVAENPPAARCRVDVNGMDCGDCARTIEASLGAMPGVQSASVNFARGEAAVDFDPARVGRSEIEARIAALGYRVATAPTFTTWLFDVTGMDCGDCARTIEAGVRRLPGVDEANVNFAASSLAVTPKPNSRLGQADVISAVQQAGYGARPQSAPPVAAAPWWRSRRALETAVAALLWLAGFAIEHGGGSRFASALPFLAAMAVAGYPVARAGWFALKARRADMNVLMTVAAIGAIAIGQWDEGSSVLILFAIGLTLQSLTLERTRRAIKALVALAPAEATVLRDSRELTVPASEVTIGEIVIVRPGDRAPVDGVVISGRSAMDQATITGESIPVEVEPGAAVFAGAINGDGVLHVRSTKAASDTTLARIIHLVEIAQSSKAPAQAFVDRFAAIYTPAVVLAALGLAAFAPLFFGDARGWFFKALVLLVVACPCALVISTPVALVAAIGAASRRGVLFKGGAAIEALAGVQAVAFDKTGTLTEGRPVVTRIVSFGDLSENEILARAASAEARSTHPLARGITRAAEECGLAVAPATGEQNLPGRGVRATVGADEILVGGRRLFATLPERIEAALADMERSGQTAVLVGTPRGVDGAIALADPIRQTSAAAVRALDAMGLHTVMLTGDNRATAERIGQAAGVAEIEAELLPEEKVAAVAKLQHARPTAMIGDGINDAPALASAAVGIAMGAGTDAAIEAADVVLAGDDLAQVPVAARLARRTMATIRTNIGAALVVKLAFLALTILGVTNLWLAVLADTGMSLLVTANSLRLLRGSDASAPAPHRHAALHHAPAPSAAD